MTFPTEAKRVGREPLQVVELILDSCANTYGVSPCTAGLAGDEKCFNTFSTCQDQANYNLTTKTYRFVDQAVKTPYGLDALPVIETIDFAATSIEPGGGLGKRASVKVRLRDFPTNDRGWDPYVDDRTYVPASRGTFFGKLKARNPFYRGRKLKLREGYAPASGSFSFDHYQDRTYLVEAIEGPDARGFVTIRAADILKRTEALRSLCPKPSNATLSRAHNASTATLTLQSSAEAAAIFNADDNVDKYLTVNDEIVKLGAQSGATLTGCLRGQGGTTAQAHGDGDKVQACKAFTDTVLTTIYQTLLTQYADVASSFIPFSDWRQESAALDAFQLTTIIPKPTSVRDLLKELNEQCLVNVWWDELTETVPLKLETPWTANVTSLDDDRHFLAGTFGVRDRHDLRVDEVTFYYGMRNYLEDLDVDNMALVYQERVDALQGSNAFDERKQQVIFSRWFDATNANQVQVTVGRKLARFKDTPEEVRFELDAKDVSSVQVGSVVGATTRLLQEADGSQRQLRIQVLEAKPLAPGTSYRYRALRYFGQPNEDEPLLITTNQTDFNLWDELSQPSDPVDVTVVIYPGVELCGANSYGFATDGLPLGSTVTLVNCGLIYGFGGNGGGGGNYDLGYESEPPAFWLLSQENGRAGSAGGDALVATVDVTIQNDAGSIFGGGGGGGGGASRVTPNVGGGGGGGGAQGCDSPAGGGGGQFEGLLGGGNPSFTDGVDGGNGSTSAAGAGGAGSGNGGDGGGGGGWGVAGTAGQGTVGQTGGSGGSPGYAVHVFSGAIVTFESGNNAANVKGAVGT